jgi:hypothetical protein
MRATLALLSLPVLLAVSHPAAADDDNLLKVSQFRGSVPGVVLRDVPSGGRPWVIRAARARLEEDGDLRLEVRGLVFAPGTVLNGVDVSGTTGPITAFAATLSCIAADGTTANVTTGGFPATPTGDATIRQRLELPPVCYAPVVLIRAFTPTTGAVGGWFAADGF